MIINLFDGEPQEGDYQIETIPDNWVIRRWELRQNKKKRTWNEGWGRNHYFPTWALCVRWARDDIASRPEVRSIDEWIRKGDRVIANAAKKIAERLI